MYHIVNTPKNFEQAANDLEAAVKNNNFGILHVHDIGETLRGKGMGFAEQCRVFEVCNPKHADRVLGIDIRLNMALPCRISVYSERGQIKIGMITPANILASLSNDKNLQEVSAEVESAMIKMINEAR